MEFKLMFKRLIFTFLSAICVAFIFIQSFMPASKSSEESSFVVHILNTITEFLGLGPVFTSHLVRKLAHFSEFTLLSVLLFFTYKQYMKREFMFSILTSFSFVIIAVIDECIQLFSYGRSCQITDVIIDSLGGTFGLVCMLIIHHILRKSSISKISKKLE